MYQCHGLSVASVATIVVLSVGLADSTRPRYDACENHLLSVCSRNQRVASQQWRVVRRLHDEVCELSEAVTGLKDALTKHNSRCSRNMSDICMSRETMAVSLERPWM